MLSIPSNSVPYLQRLHALPKGYVGDIIHSRIIQHINQADIEFSIQDLAPVF